MVRPGRMANDPSRRVRRYTLHLEGCTDPITLIAKRTNHIEAALYRSDVAGLEDILPPCHFVHCDEDICWLILEDVPNDFPPERWTPGHVDKLIETLATAHTQTWRGTMDQVTNLAPQPVRLIEHFIAGDEVPYTWDQLRHQHAALFEQGPGAVLSEHAIRHAGRLAPSLLEAANGVVVMRDLGGWPGVLGESHLAAAADLLDDPVPLLSALNSLPVSLLHGSPHPYHWRVTLFDESYLVDWSEATWGPGVIDLISFIEHYPLIYGSDCPPGTPPDNKIEDCDLVIRLRDMSPLMEETLIDSYLLAMSGELGPRFPARAYRAAVPAARCLHVLVNWFAYFGSWFAEMPDPYVWQRVNRMSEAELKKSGMGPMAGVRPYLAGVFERFLRAYHSL